MYIRRLKIQLLDFDNLGKKMITVLVGSFFFSYANFFQFDLQLYLPLYTVNVHIYYSQHKKEKKPTSVACHKHEGKYFLFYFCRYD